MSMQPYLPESMAKPIEKQLSDCANNPVQIKAVIYKYKDHYVHPAVYEEFGMAQFQLTMMAEQGDSISESAVKEIQELIQDMHSRVREK